MPAPAGQNEDVAAGAVQGRSTRDTRPASGDVRNRRPGPTRAAGQLRILELTWLVPDLVQTFAELRRLLEDGTRELVVILATAKRAAFEVAELALFLYAPWLIIGRRQTGDRCGE